MIDRLIGVGGHGSAGQAEFPVEADAGAEGEDARGHAGEQTGRGASAVALEQELVFERVDDRLDSLPDPADRRAGPVGLVGAAGAQQEGPELAHGGFEVGAGEALVADQERTLEWVGLEQCERRFTFGGVGGNEVEVADGAVGGAEQDELKAPVAARVGGAVAKAGASSLVRVVWIDCPQGSGVVSSRRSSSAAPSVSAAIAFQSSTSFGASARQRSL